MFIDVSWLLLNCLLFTSLLCKNWKVSYLGQLCVNSRVNNSVLGPSLNLFSFPDVIQCVREMFRVR